MGLPSLKEIAAKFFSVANSNQKPASQADQTEPETTEIRVSKTNMGTSAEALMVDPENRPRGWHAFNLSQAGGYGPEYYTVEEAKQANKLAYLKYASVSMVTFSVMKIISPIFDNPIVTSMPSIGAVDTKLLLLGGTAAATWWGISQLDAAVMHNMRSQKAARYAATHHGIQDKEAQKRQPMSLVYRYGISLGSLGISLPALWIAVSEKTIDEHNLNIHRESNAYIVEEYKANLASLDTIITTLQTADTTMRGRLQDIISPGKVITTAQQTELDALNARILALQSEIANQQDAMRAEEKKRDDAQLRADQEQGGTNGAKEGEGPRYRDAIADREAAKLRIDTITDTITRLTTDVNGLQQQVATINTAIETATNAKIAQNNSTRSTLEKQIDSNKTELDAQLERRDKIDDINALAEADPRYNHLNADIAEKAAVYVDYMMTKANPFDWGMLGAFGAIVACAELLVFYQAAKKPLNKGEERGYLAEFLKSREASEAFNKKLIEMQMRSDLLDRETVNRIKEGMLRNVDDEMFKQIVEEYRNDPALRQAMKEHMAEYMSEMMFTAKKKDPGNDGGNGPAPQPS